MRVAAWWVVGGALGLLSACGSVRNPALTSATPPPAMKPAPTVVVKVPPEPLPAAIYAEYVQRLTPAEQEKEIERARLAFNRDRSDLRRLHYGMALALSASTPTTRRAAAPVLEPLLKDVPGRESEIHAIAGLLMELIQEQRRGDELERKLDAMKEIERTLMQRERASPAAAGGAAGNSGGKP